MVGVAEQIAAGDLAVTVTKRSEHDALGHALANMVERLSTLMGEVQRSGMQVNTSVNEIAATAKQQQATASEIAATTTEIGATSKEISATSKELVKTMNEVSDGGRAIGHARGQRAGRPDAHGGDHAPGHGRRRLDQRQAGRAQREGRQHQPGGHDHHQGGRSDEPAVAQRGDRSREGRRVRPRLCGRGDRDPPPGRPDRGGDLRHRADGQGNPVGRLGRRDGHGQVLGGSAPRHAGRPAGRRPVVADHSAGAGAGAARAKPSTKACRRRRPAPSRSPRRSRS